MKLLPMNPAPPVTSTSTIADLQPGPDAPGHLLVSAGAAPAEGPEEVREGSDPREGDREVEPPVLIDGIARRPQAAQVERLVLEREPAALGVVVPHDALLQEAPVPHVVRSEEH